MKPTPVWQRLDGLARNVAPFGTTLVLLIASIVPLHVPVLNLMVPSVSLISVYYWCLYRPDLLPAPAAFAIGLLEDVLTGAPVGVGAMVLVLVHALVGSQRRFFAGKSFAVIWLGFTAVAAGGFLLAWLLVSAFYGVFVDITAVAVQAAVTIGFLPLIWRLLLRVHLTLLRQADA
jgi:rod shape-determining protein MreD